MAEVSCDRMTRLGKSKYIKEHLAEITEDIRNLPKGKVLEKWGFGQSTFHKLRKQHAPELIGRRPRKDQEPQPTGQAELSEHERYLVLIGYQMAVRELLKADKNHA